MTFEPMEEAVVIFLFVGVALMLGNNGGYANSTFIWGPAMLFTIPFMFFNALASLPFAVFLVPLGVMAIAFYFNKLGQNLTPGYLFWIAFGAVIVLLAS